MSVDYLLGKLLQKEKKQVLMSVDFIPDLIPVDLLLWSHIKGHVYTEDYTNREHF